MSAVGIQMGSTMSMGSTGSTETESSLESSCGKDSASTSSSSSTCEPASSSSYVSVAGRKVLEDSEPQNVIPVAPVAPPFPTVAANIDLSSAIAQELQRRAQVINYHSSFSLTLNSFLLILTERSLSQIFY